jgi:acyl-CoA synthetase (NDP forming)
MAPSTFIDEATAYDLLDRAGLATPRRGLVRGPGEASRLPFKPGEAVVVKGVADGVWHKSDLGLVRFGSFEADGIQALAAEMEALGRPHGAWIGTLVCEKVAFKRVSGLPTEALAALRWSAEAGWTLVLGLGGLHTNAWGEEIRPLLWPLALMTPEQALAELRTHWLGRTWLGHLRQGEPLTDEAALLTFLRGLWKLAGLLEAEGATLLEMNPVVISPEGHPMALDGVGSGEALVTTPLPTSGLSPAELRRILVTPRSIALAGVSSRPGSPGRIILENLLRSSLPRTAIRPIKPGETEILGLPCLGGVEDLASDPVDILILSLPALLTVQAIEQLCAQGGGASVLYLVPGGLGDGADTQGLGQRVVDLLRRRREAGLWTPALVGPNGLGFLASPDGLNTLFIPPHKLPFMARGGGLSLVSQSGAFLITRLSTQPELPLRYGVSIGNQLDVRLSHFVEALGEDPETRVIATYLEGFAPGDLLPFALAAKALQARGKWVVAYKGGWSAEGQKAASSHTGALAGDWDLQKALLRRAGVIVCESMGLFDAVLAWLAAHSKGRPSRVAVLTNAGYESVLSADLLEGALGGHALEGAETETLREILTSHHLQDLVNPRLPLDLTPMADGQAYLDCVDLVAASAADTVVVGIVPLTQRLETQDPAAMAAFARAMAKVARERGKRLGLVVEGGPQYEAYRQAFQVEGLPVFTSMERALLGLRALAQR